MIEEVNTVTNLTPIIVTLVAAAAVLLIFKWFSRDLGEPKEKKINTKEVKPEKVVKAPKEAQPDKKTTTGSKELW